jgi:hypothetical protein
MQLRRSPKAESCNPLDSVGKTCYRLFMGALNCPPKTRNMIAAPTSTYLGIAAQSSPLKPLLLDRSSGVATD